MTTLAITATEFKAKCFDLLDQVGAHQIGRLEITKRGKLVAVVTPPPTQADEAPSLYGFMEGSVVIPQRLDLTAPVMDEPWDAEQGILHR